MRESARDCEKEKGRREEGGYRVREALLTLLSLCHCFWVSQRTEKGKESER